ncbi:FAD-binding protein [Pseudoroseicyclus sp. CXY001]|uniref:FAD-binding protein n=1 Tax=Pseudoroseicyclus sp. CXY001 TaxID=3242492 RepID=UPI003570B697
MTDQQKSASRVSRRGFMKAAGLGAAGTSMGVVTVSSAQAQSWDQETDVIAVGSGGAAFAGAVGAIDNGAEVIMLEKAPYTGGTTAKSGGGFWIPNSPYMRAMGIEDSKEDFLRYCARVSFPELYNDQSETYGLYDLQLKLLDTYYDNAARVVETLNDSGALPSTMALSWEGEPGSDYHAQLAENAGIRGRQTSTRNEDGTEGFGADMIYYFENYVLDHGGEILTSHRVTKIVREEDGRVIGVVADTPDGERMFRARKGVIFGSGGFTHNKQMRTTYLRTPVMGGCAVPTNEGDLILMASEIGAKLGNLNEAWNQQEILEEVLEYSSVPSGVFFLGGDSMIAVNRFGQRMYDEKYVYPERTRSHQAYDIFNGDYPNLYQMMIFDEKAREFGGFLIPQPGADLPKHVITGATWEELAANIQARFDSLASEIGSYKLADNFTEALAETVTRFNGFAETGVDEDFHRGEAPIDRFFHAIPLDRGYPNPYMAPISEEGPYYAILLAAGTLDTKGGPVFNENAQVISTRDEPIPGLYVAGNAGASPSGKSYLGGGGTLGLGITFGYMAGEHAASQG